DELAFQPGQYMNIQVPGTDQIRSYSFSSGPLDGDCSFMVRITPQGAMSDYLSERAELGDTVTMTGPYGSFFLRATQLLVLLLACGTGLVLILSILAKFSIVIFNRRINLIY